jgi:hypothetical protein
MALLDIDAANREALDRLCRARPAWTGVRVAREALGLSDHAVLHAGPPITWERMCGPMLGGIVAAILFERWADTPAAALDLAASGAAVFAPCHSCGAVGPMTGIISPSMPVMVVEDRANGTVAYATFGETGGQQARFGAHGAETVARLGWLRDVLAPALRIVVEREGGVDLAALMGQALAMGDEMHMRNAAATGLLARRLAAPLAGTVRDGVQLEAILRYLTLESEQIFLNFAMASAKAAARSIEGIAGSTVVCAMARNGVEFGIRVAGLGDRWFAGPASVVDGLYFPGFTAADANPDIGDSAIMETYGLGAMAMAASPPVLQIVGAKSFADAVATTRRMAEICVGANPTFPIAALDGEGTPTGIDIRKVVETGITPVMNTAIAHRDMKAGRMIGAGIATAPMAPFQEALAAFVQAYAG